MAYKKETSLEMILQYLKTGSTTLSGSRRKNLETSLTELLGYLASSATKPGLVELATNAEAQTKTDTTRAVTPANLGPIISGFKTFTFTGKNGAGDCTVSGLLSTDTLLSVAGMTTPGNASASFSATLKADAITQSSASNLSAETYILTIWRAV